ncbi:hypothetical protein [Sphingomonas sp.]|uniref:hypothetical protein n=1 Tax=Sphingomonas sp. TaxID=28214 RepID=UPI00307F1A67
MTVLELAIFLCVYRTRGPTSLQTLGPVLSNWFECPVCLGDLTDPVANMLEQGWLVQDQDGLKPSRRGRCGARHLMNGIIRILDHGTRLIDVALMLSVLRLTKGELDAGDPRC